MKSWKFYVGWLIVILMVFLPAVLYAKHLGLIHGVFGVIGISFFILAVLGGAHHLINKEKSKNQKHKQNNG